MAAAGTDSTPFGGIELVERAVGLLVRLPVRIWCVYLVGIVCFGLLGLFYLTDMSVNPFALDRLFPFSFAVTLSAFVWRACQSRFSAELLAVLGRMPSPHWSPGDWLRVAGQQMVFLAALIVLMPIALVVVLPAGWLLVYFHEAVIFGGTRSLRLAGLHGVAWSQVMRWPRQNHVALLVVSGVALVGFLNLYSLVLFVPFIFEVFTGVETVVTRSPLAALNSTVFVVVCFLTYAIVSPLLRACYVVRHYHLHARESGRDLRDRLRVFVAFQSKAKAVALLLGVLALGNVEGQEAGVEPSAVSVQEIDLAIRDVVERPEFAWRMPGAVGDSVEMSALARWVRKAGRWTKRAIEWLIRKLLVSDKPGNPSGSWFEGMGGARPLLTVLLLVVAVLLGLLVYRLVRQSRAPEAASAPAVQVRSVPDVDDVQTLASDLPEDEWMVMARDFVAAGDYRRALRAYYLSVLAHLHEQRIVRITRAKSNATYLKEVGRHAHRAPELTDVFRQAVRVFDRVWYGEYEVDREGLTQFESWVQSIRAHS